MRANTLDIQSLFEPQAVAIIGASANKNKIGYKIVENIVTGGYTGQIYPVNPKGGEILGLPVYRSLDEIEADLDLVTITIPAKFVFQAVQACAAKKVKYLSIITSGFSEVGNVKAERELVAYTHAHGMRVLGPNIFGVYSAPKKSAQFSPMTSSPICIQLPSTHWKTRMRPELNSGSS